MRVFCNEQAIRIIEWMITKGEREFISLFLDLYEITVYKYYAYPTLGNFDSILAMYQLDLWGPFSISGLLFIIAMISNLTRMNII